MMGGVSEKLEKFPLSGRIYANCQAAKESHDLTKQLYYNPVVRGLH